MGKQTIDPKTINLEPKMCFFRNLGGFAQENRSPVINRALIEGIPRETPLARWDPSVGAALQLKQVICLSCATGQFGTPPQKPTC